MTERDSLKSVQVDGVRIAYLEAGEGAPLLLLHGYPQSHRTWRKQLPELSKHRRVFAPDWPGWGASERAPAKSTAYAEEVRRLVELVDALGLGTFDLFGHDYGGLLSLGLLARHPERVSRFAILNSKAHLTFAQPYYALLRAVERVCRSESPTWRALLRRVPWAWIHAKMLAKFVALGCFDAALLQEYVGWMATEEGVEWLLAFYAGYEAASRHELLPTLSRIRCPTAVIWGDRDSYFPWHIAEALAREIPGATLTRIEGAEHYVMEERPRETLDALLGLLARPAGDRPAAG